MIAVISFVLAGCAGGNQRKIPPMTETYEARDKNPFGANIAYRLLKSAYPTYTITDKKTDFKDTWENISDTNALYVCMAPRLFVNSDDVSAMMDFVEEGNTLFIAAGQVDALLMDKLGCSQVYSSPAVEQLVGKMKTTWVSAAFEPGSKYGYYYYPFETYFTDITSDDIRVMGYNEKHQPNFIVYFRGRGKLFLQCDPRAYSNYFLLKENNYAYLKNSFAFASMQPQHIYWDDHYYKLSSRNNDEDDNNNDQSSLSEIMKYPPLKAAFWLSLLLLLLYILFGGKRVQRIIKPIKPNENTTVTFTETIGRLYLQKKDNKNIADKMITYFNEYIRNTYFLNTNHINDDFITVLSRKSGVERGRVDTLYRSIVATQGSDVVSDYQLLSLQEQVQQFYKHTG